RIAATAAVQARCPRPGCDVILRSLRDLDLHRKWHNRQDHQKFYECEHCDFASTVWSELVEHRKMSHVKCYVCEVCEKSYKTSSGLIEHLLVKHGIDARKRRSREASLALESNLGESGEIHDTGGARHQCNWRYNKKHSSRSILLHSGCGFIIFFFLDRKWWHPFTFSCSSCCIANYVGFEQNITRG
ncbi:unnamed protein product, partial [Amoebophrya sp. A25]